MSDDEESDLETFHEQVGENAACVKPPSARIAALAQRVPGALISFWESYGWCSYMEGLLRFCDPEAFADIKRYWHLPDEALIIAQSGFGDLLYVHEDKLKIIFVHTGRYLVSIFGYATFLATLMDIEAIQDYFFGDLYSAAVQRLGTPDADEMFSFEPALALGGTVDIEHIVRVKTAPAHAFLAQIHGELIPF